MDITEHAIHMLADMERSVQDHYRDFTDLANGFEHVQRVYHLALHLAEQEQADGFIVGMAALLHDLRRMAPGPMRSHSSRPICQRCFRSYSAGRAERSAVRSMRPHRSHLDRGKYEI
jgi:HD domain-containing protein